MRLPLAVAALAALALPRLALAQNPAVTVNVNAGASRRAISDDVYGLAFASPSVLTDLRISLHRWGGNPTTRYNWQLNADNRGADWYFQSIAYGSATPGDGPDDFIADSRAGGAEPMMTIPMVGWVAKVGPGRGKLASFSIAKYGAQQANDWQWMPDAGNGVRPNGDFVTGNDFNDANVPADAAFHQGWFQHLVQRWGSAADGGLRYYILDNEPSIWHATHRDVHPEGARMQEVLDKTIAFASAIKDVDPGAKVVGPEEWGWSGYLFSGYDLQYGDEHGWGFLPDRAAHGNQDYLPWLLSQLRQAEGTLGRRLLDVFTVHYYPQGGEFGNDTSAAMQQRRNRSTRSLWDPAYTDETWINDEVRLIPRLREWADTYYHPGTPIGITEYNWGAEGHINGATTQADVLGIFGREGLDLAARWTTPDPASLTYAAIKMYRNYDNLGSGFGELSVAAAVPNPDNLSAFASLRSWDGALTVMVISKVLTGDTPVTVNLANFPWEGPAQVWRLRSTGGIQRLADLAVTSGQLVATVPAQSLTLFVVPPSDLIFRDGLESGNVSAWSTSATNDGDLSVTAAAALDGTRGLAALVDDTAALYVQDDRPDAESRYRARFQFDPNGFDPGTASGHLRTRLAIAFQENPSRRLVTLVLRRVSGQYGLMARVRLDDGTVRDTPFVAISDAPHTVEVSWQRARTPGAADGTFQMWIDGASVATLGSLDTDERRIDFARMGALSVKVGAAGTLYFDKFESRRRTAIGP